MVIGSTHISGRLFQHYIRSYDLPVAAPGLAIGVINGMLWILGFLISLTILGVSIAPLLTALGIGGLAVSLALKDTLENIFAGINVLMEKSIRVGDFIRLESGQEGSVKGHHLADHPHPASDQQHRDHSQQQAGPERGHQLSPPEKLFSLRLPVSVSYRTGSAAG